MKVIGQHHVIKVILQKLISHLCARSCGNYLDTSALGEPLKEQNDAPV